MAITGGGGVEAEWLVLTANQKHGLQRSSADKQWIIRQAFLHLYKPGDRASLGGGDKRVGKIRREMEVTAEIPQLQQRMVQKADGWCYQIDRRNTGSKSSP